MRNGDLSKADGVGDDDFAFDDVTMVYYLLCSYILVDLMEMTKCSRTVIETFAQGFMSR